MRRFWGALGALLLAAAARSAAATFEFPTANHALLEPNGGERFFVGTEGKDWTSGQFGCVRSGGHKFHEGVDIRCLERDRRGEPLDAVMASADGEVAYINTRPGLSNYGNYVVIRHRIDGLEVYTLYAHLSAVAPGLRVGKAVRAGERVATMGRTSNTRQSITRERAHCHFEINLVANERFAEWFHGRNPGERNDHGNFNGHNLLGVNPAEVLRACHGGSFNLASWLKNQPTMCRLAIRTPHLPWIRRYPHLLDPNPATTREGTAGYDVLMNFNGIILRAVPRTAAELGPGPRFQVLSVNEAEHDAHPCSGLVARRGGSWSLTNRGHDLLELLTY